jgi:predicted nucleic acid-binding protein
MNRYVLDCSVTMAWCFADENDPRAQFALTALEVQEAIVPCHWPLEVANVLTTAERKKRIAPERIPVFIGILNRLPIVVDEHTAEKAFVDVLALARAYRLSAYDAAYLELALRTGCPLASLDASLNKAAVSLGIVLFEG